jgi:hypothetical protein
MRASLDLQSGVRRECPRSEGRWQFQTACCQHKPVELPGYSGPHRQSAKRHYQPPRLALPPLRRPTVRTNRADFPRSRVRRGRDILDRVADLKRVGERMSDVVLDPSRRVVVAEFAEAKADSVGNDASDLADRCSCHVGKHCSSALRYSRDIVLGGVEELLADGSTSWLSPRPEFFASIISFAFFAGIFRFSE